MDKGIILFFLCISTSSIFGQNMGLIAHNHIALQVKDISVSSAFYRDILGLEVIPVPDNLKSSRAWFKIGDQQIHLLDGRTHNIDNDRNGSHFALTVTNISQSESYLKAKNINYHLQTRFDGVTQIYFSDPDGYLIELNQVKTSYE